MKYNKWIPLNEAVKEYASGFEEDQLHSPDTKQVIPPKDEEDESMDEVAPPGWEGVVKAMKKHKGITNPWALAWSMKHKGYHPHKVEEELNEIYEEVDEAVGEDKPKKLPLRRALGKLYPEEEPLDLPKPQKRIYQTIRPEEEEPEKIDEAEEQEKPTYQSVKKQYFDPKTKTMRDIDWIQKVEPKPAPEKPGEEVDEDVQGGGQSQVRSYRTQYDSTENPQWDLEPDETEPRKSESYPEEDEEQEEGRLDESVRNRLMKNAGIKKKADKKLDEYFYYYYNPETGKVEKKSGLHNPKTSPYLGPKASGERPMITKAPEGGHKMTFVPSDLPKQPGEVDEAEETGFRRVVSRPKMTASPEDVEKWSKELQARKPHSEEPFIKAGEEYMKSKHPSAYLKYQAKKSERQSTDYVDKLRNQARKELFGAGEDIEEAVQKRSYRTSEDLPEGYEEEVDEGKVGDFFKKIFHPKETRSEILARHNRMRMKHKDAYDLLKSIEAEEELQSLNSFDIPKKKSEPVEPIKFNPDTKLKSHEPYLGEKDMDEETGTGAVAGYQTPFAFGKGDQTQSRAMKANKSIGYEPVGKLDEDYANGQRMMPQGYETEELAHHLRKHLTEVNVDNISVSALDEKMSPVGESVLVDYSDLKTNPSHYVFVSGKEQPHTIHWWTHDGEKQEEIKKYENLSLDEVKDGLVQISEYIHSLPKEEEEEEELQETPYGRREIKHSIPPKQPLQETCKKMKNMLGY